MKLSELKQIVDANIEHSLNKYDADVVVVTNDRSIGGTSCTKVRGIGLGFDWDSGKFMIFTQDKITKK